MLFSCFAILYLPVSDSIYFLITFGNIQFAILFGRLYRYVWSKIGIPEFDISRGSLGLVFNQTLLWVGLLFSPPLAGIVAIKMIITFYLKVILINTHLLII